MRRCAFVTLGCKANHYDTQVVREGLLASGYEEVPPSEPADLVVVNTCTVTHASARKSRQEIRRIVRSQPRAQVVVTGCYAESDRRALLALDGVDLVVGNARKAEIARLVREQPRYREEEPLPVWGPHEVPAAFGITHFTGQTRAFVKIEEGCDVFCSFCIIPYVRGPVRSRPLPEVVEEVRRLAGGGFREVVLTGIHLGGYGRDLGQPALLARLLLALERVPALERVRLSSLDAWEIGPELLATMAGLERLAPHLHVPLQSGDDGVLARMRRRYDAARYLETLDRVRERLPDAAISTDLIVGFPGEDEPAFERTLDLARRAAFMRLHVFPYSDRQGTPAARFQPKTPDSTKAERAARAGELGRELALAWKRRFLGRVIPVLAERARDPDTGMLAGYSDRYVRTLFPGPDAWRGRILPVRVVEVSAEAALGRAAA